MEKLKRSPESGSIPQRLTLYVRPQHRELVRWVQAYAQTDSLSEAVFSALADLKALARERQHDALARTHGIWKGDPAIGEAFSELESGWEEWHRQTDGS